MHYTYTPSGVHSKSIEFDIEDNIVKNVKIIGGCKLAVTQDIPGHFNKLVK